MVEEFKAFAFKGNVIDMAVGVMIGTAFGKITTSIVNDVFMPALSLVTGSVNLSGLFLQLDFYKEGAVRYPSIEAAKEAGVGTLNYGAFLQTVVDFLLIALCVFLFVKLISRFRKKEEEAPKPEPRLCPYCRSVIADDATRCPHCTSQL
ncbi:MAG: large conductance mechanosensitive channel protein MscL [Eubacteriales bacterium]|nr:large conductance mechanosensitive channel protein MscL [Eubacteriales bacterium]